MRDTAQNAMRLKWGQVVVSESILMQALARSLRSTSVTHCRNQRLTMRDESAQESLGPRDGDVHESLRDSDPLWADAYFRMSTHPWTNGVLSGRLVELIAIGLNGPALP
jgi:hypothetical protein